MAFTPDVIVTTDIQSVPVLLCIWLIGASRQKPDKEVRDRRLDESRPAPAVRQKSNDLPPHHTAPAYQAMSEPDAQGRVMYKIHMTTAASQLPSRQTDAQRAAKLIYGSVIKKYGNP